jgi:hypothetical protein
MSTPGEWWMTNEGWSWVFSRGVQTQFVGAVVVRVSEKEDVFQARIIPPAGFDAPPDFYGDSAAEAKAWAEARVATVIADINRQAEDVE